MLRTDLDHVPARKRRELDAILKILFEEFEEARKTRLSDKHKNGRILKIILYGSQARGDAVEDPVSGYYSDYDLLVIVDRQALTAKEDYWHKAEDRFVEMRIRKQLKQDVSLIVHTLQDVNDQLARGRYFFIDIVRDGIALFEARGHNLAAPKPLSEEAAREEAQGYFDQWFVESRYTLKLSRIAMGDGKLRKSAFLLHQACEEAYHCTLLVLTLYTPATHNLSHLHNRCIDLDRRFLAIWPRDSRLAKRSFARLKDAYVKARYSKHYRITREELDWLVERVEALQALVETVCRERLARR